MLLPILIYGVFLALFANSARFERVLNVSLVYLWFNCELYIVQSTHYRNEGMVAGHKYPVLLMSGRPV